MLTLRTVPRAHSFAFQHDCPACYSRPHQGKEPGFTLSRWPLLRDHPKSTGSSSRGPGWHPNGSSQTSVIPVPDDPAPSPASTGTTHMWCTYIHAGKNGKTPIHKNTSLKQDYPKEHDKLSDIPPHLSTWEGGTGHTPSSRSEWLSRKAWCIPYDP